ncbi:hypothetical protein [Sphingomonas sp. ID0503]|uniref:hypothetical protein n=1 Tax=Sphingomonas sp. ID0503 TaxID=3399691 RepID=UPI003AFA9FB2
MLTALVHRTISQGHSVNMRNHQLFPNLGLAPHCRKANVVRCVRQAKAADELEMRVGDEEQC